MVVHKVDVKVNEDFKDLDVVFGKLLIKSKGIDRVLVSVEKTFSGIAGMKPGIAGVGRELEKIASKGKAFKQVENAAVSSAKNSEKAFALFLKRSERKFKVFAGRVSQQFGKLGQSIGGALNSGLGRFIGFAAVTGGLIAATKAASEFEKAMTEVSTLMGPANEGLEELTKNAKEQSLLYGGSVVQNAQATYQAISAGATDAAEAMILLDTANKLALGGVSDAPATIDLLTTSINAFGLEFERSIETSDSFFTTVKLGKTTISELAQSYGQIAPVAAQANVTLDETNAAIATLTKLGIRTPEAITALKGALSGVLKPSDDAAKFAKQLGIDFTLAGIKAKGFGGFMTDIKEKTGGSAESLARLFPNVRALTAVLTLTGKGADDFAASLEAMTTKAGATDAAAKKMAGTFDNQWSRAVEKVNAGMVTLGDIINTAVLPVLKIFNDHLDTVAIALAGVATVALVTLAPAIGTALVGALAVATAGTFTWAGAMGVASGAMTALNVVIAANPIGAIAIAVTLAITAFAMWFNEMRKTEAGVVGIGDAIKVFGAYLQNTFKAVIVDTWNAGIKAVEKFVNIFNTVKQVYVNAFNFMKEKFTSFVDFIGTKFPLVQKYLISPIKAYLKFLTSAGKLIKDTFLGWITWIGELAGKARDGILSIFPKAALKKEGEQAGTAAGEGFLSKMSGYFDKGKKKMSELASQATAGATKVDLSSNLKTTVETKGLKEMMTDVAGAAAAQDKLKKATEGAAKAAKELKEQQDTKNLAGIIEKQKAQREATEALTKARGELSNIIGAERAKIAENIQLAGMSNQARQVEQRMISLVNAAKQTGLTISAQTLASLRSEITGELQAIEGIKKHKQALDSQKATLEGITGARDKQLEQLSNLKTLLDQNKISTDQYNESLAKLTLTAEGTIAAFGNEMKALESSIGLLKLDKKEREIRIKLLAKEKQLQAGGVAGGDIQNQLSKYRELIELQSKEQQLASTKESVLGGIKEAQDQYNLTLAVSKGLFEEGEIGANRYFQVLAGAKEKLASVMGGGEGEAGFGETFGKNMEDMMVTGADMANELSGLIDSTFGKMEDAMVSFVTTGKLDVKGLIDSMIADFARFAIKTAIMGPLKNALGSAMGGMGGGGGGGGSFNLGSLFGGGGGGSMSTPFGMKTPASFATGGFISGAGTGTSDSIPAMLSNGEHVTNAESTKKYRALLEMINNDNVPGFASGGITSDSTSPYNTPYSTPSLGAPQQGSQQPVVNNINVVVNNSNGATVREERKPNNTGGFDIKVIIDQVETKIADKAAAGGSKLNNALENRYNLNSAAGIRT